nr:hypothetical protein [uncultured Rhodopila sp.]
MSPVRVILIGCLALAPGAWFVTTGQPVAAQQTDDSGPLEVTTDTPEYCQYLHSRVDSQVHLASAPPSREVTDLSAEGERMCEHGQTRGGIMRLRRALLLLMHDDGTSAPER